MRVLLYGASGFVGSQLKRVLHHMGDTVVEGTARLENYLQIEQDLDFFQPDRVVCATGRTHGQENGTIDFLENRLDMNLTDNLVGPLMMLASCLRRDIHCTLFGTGCIFESEYLPNGQVIQSFSEEDIGNFSGSSYSCVKGALDKLCHHPHFSCLLVRIRMPFVDFISDRCFIQKIAKYPKICSVQNSMSYLPNLLPLLVQMIHRKAIGPINLCNPGTISHDEVLEKYKQVVDENHYWDHFNEEEMLQVVKVRRSNNMLNTKRLEKEFPQKLMTIHEAMDAAMLGIKSARESVHSI